MTDEQRRTDLPRDQVSNDNDGFQAEDNNRVLDEDSLAQDAFAEDPFEEETNANETNSVLNENESNTFHEEAKRDEETATEFAPTAGARRDVQNRTADNDVENNRESAADDDQVATGLGWTGLVLSVLSLFLFPVLTATIGVVVGFFAYRRNARTLGLWAIGIGAFSLIINLFFAPFFLT